jgi:hypothetical protein
MLGWADRLFYKPDSKERGNPAEFGIDYEQVFFSNPSGMSLCGWFLPARNRESALGTIVQFHGNAGNISGHFKLVAWFVERGYNVFCFDYRGYGLSEGSISREGSIEDSNAALDYLKTRHDVDPRRIQVIGQSLGAAIALVVRGQRDDMAAFVLDCPFTTYRAAVAHVLRKTIFLWPAARLLSSLLFSKGWDPIDYIRKTSGTPTMFIEAGGDEILDHRMTVELYAASAHPKMLKTYDDVLHCQAWFDDRCKERARSEVIDFFVRAMASKTNSRPKQRMDFTGGFDGAII